MELRRTFGRIAGAIGILLICTGPASAKQLCLSVNAEQYLLSGKIPKKNACSSIILVNTNGTFTGFVASGGMCLSSDGTTVLFTTSDGFFGYPETLQGSWVTSTGDGSVNDCIVPDTGTICFSDTVTVASCTGNSIPDAVSGPAALSVKRSAGD